MLRRFAFLLLLVLYKQVSCYAQLSAGVYLKAGYPFDVQHQGFYNRPSAGIGISAEYRLRQSNVFPCASFSINNIQLPIYSANFNDLNTQATLKNLNLDLGYRLNSGTHPLIFMGGISVLSVRPDVNGIQSNGSSTALLLKTDGHSYLFPGVNAGLKYMHRLKNTKAWYVGAEANISYIYLFANTNYYIENGVYTEDVSIVQYLLFPSFSLSINYLFGVRG